MRRGDVYWVDLEPAVGSEASKVRPAVLVSNDVANRAAARTGSGVITVVPMTANVARVLPFQVLVAAAEAAFPRTRRRRRSKFARWRPARLGERAGSLHGPTLQAIDEALRLHLAL